MRVEASHSSSKREEHKRDSKRRRVESRDEGSGSQSVVRRGTCHAFERTGRCRFGDRCKYSHVISAAGAEAVWRQSMSSSVPKRAYDPENPNIGLNVGGKGNPMSSSRGQDLNPGMNPFPGMAPNPRMRPIAPFPGMTPMGRRGPPHPYSRPTLISSDSGQYSSNVRDQRQPHPDHRFHTDGDKQVVDNSDQIAADNDKEKTTTLRVMHLSAWLMKSSPIVKLSAHFGKFGAVVNVQVNVIFLEDLI